MYICHQTTARLPNKCSGVRLYLSSHACLFTYHHMLVSSSLTLACPCNPPPPADEMRSVPSICMPPYTRSKVLKSGTGMTDPCLECYGNLCPATVKTRCDDPQSKHDVPYTEAKEPAYSSVPGDSRWWEMGWPQNHAWTLSWERKPVMLHGPTTRANKSVGWGKQWRSAGSIFRVWRKSVDSPDGERACWVGTKRHQTTCCLAGKLVTAKG